MIVKFKELFIKYKRIIIFAVVGGINTLVDVGVFTAFKELTGIPSWYCQALGYTAGVICSFVINQKVTFRDGEKGNLFYKLLRFVVINTISLGISVFGMKLMVSGGMNDYIAKAIITVVTMVINYIGYKTFVFRVKGR
jgi:putative flippase GtrA